MKTTIITVRHGETEWNRIGKYQGHLNSNLTDAGIKQAGLLGKTLKYFNIDYFYSSDLGRAVKTSEIISEKINLGFKLDGSLRERKLGIFQGLTSSEAEVKYPDAYKMFYSNNPDYQIPDGESLKEKYLRSVKCLESIADKHRGKTVLITTHGGILESFMYKIFDMPLSRKRSFLIVNCALNQLSIDSTMDWGLDFWGEISHLRNENIEVEKDENRINNIY